MHRKYRTDDLLNNTIDKISWLDGIFIPGYLLRFCFYNAKSRNIEFNITISDLENQWNLQEGKCAYTGIELTLPKSSTDRLFNASVDRIDSSEPYIIGNIQWVLKEVNIMKMSLSEERFLELCKRISARF